MSLRWRWALGLGLVAALAIGLMAVAALLSAQRQLRGAVDQDLRERSVELRQWARELVERGQRQVGRPYLGIVDYDAVVQAFDKTGEVRLLIGPEGVALPVDKEDLETLELLGRPIIRDVEIAGRPFRMITVTIGWSDLAFQIATDLSDVNENLAGLTRRLLTVGIVGVLVVGLTGWTLASRAVRPITDLTGAAEQIATTERLDAGRRLDTSAPGEVGRLAAAFMSMIDSLAKSRREQQRLVSDAGHQLRTPITALKTNLEILRRQGDGLSSEQRGGLIENALDESNQLADLATELVDLASDVRHTDEQVGDVHLGEIAAELINRYRRPGGKSVTVSGDGAVIKGRRSQIERALSNLVDNAAKWADTLIEVKLDGTTVTVVDDGAGIPEVDIPHVFRRFYRSDEARSTPGSGLGLAIVEHLVDAHGGTVFAHNSPDGGAEVGFVLPQG